MIEYNVDDKGIIWVTFSGTIIYNLISQWLKKFSAFPDMPLNLNIIYDLRNSTLNLSKKELYKVAILSSQSTSNFMQVRTVFLIKEADIGTYSRLFNFLKSNERTIRKAYFNVDDAYNWLLSEKEKFSINFLG